MTPELGLKRDPMPTEAEGERRAEPLSACVRQAVERYFSELDGHAPGDLYDLVISEIEPPLIAVVMRHAQGNITRAAEMLGLNRATLRKKLLKYGLDA